MANNFGQGITGKAVSERFLRMKKEEPWNLTINREAGGVEKPTPKKKTPKGRKKVADDAGNSDDEDEFSTPSKKKAPLNKVQNGRITKKTGGPGASFSGELIKDEFVSSFNSHENEYGYNSDSFNMEGFHREQEADNASYPNADDGEA